ncbi:glycoside hydrolase family 36 protein [Tilletiaria anomala UBC 951]|uniref:Glycoside hydrolase family 36 protein n=1 Tax=Tilletiaria anomala (strain ATCC 24038 / CBS 436.72 / UBC 951) TaxID=1037660 RepID=A0A066W0T0_TILAU|nr:glycoside hydrolase family 36 protein [Tilletiaria anomala UBC 951]KDN44679.1 glycoside hydrolase family 36 protein [Tilletiaria anomala UBC 951]
MSSDHSRPVFDPPLNSHHHLRVSSAHKSESTLASNKDDSLEIFFVAHEHNSCSPFSDLKPGSLQIWTDLPAISTRDVADDGTIEGWTAFDFLPSTSSALKGLHVCALKVPRSSLSIRDYHFTYRRIHPDDRIEWFGNGANDGTVTVLGRDDGPSDSTFSVLGLSNEDNAAIPELNANISTDHDGNEDPIQVRLLSFALASTEDEDSYYHVCTPCTTITGGVSLERTKTAWLTSRTLTSFADMSTQYGASLLVLRFLKMGSCIAVFFPISTSTFSTSLLRSHDAKSLYLRVSAFDPLQTPPERAHVVVATGTESQLHNVIEAAICKARQTLGSALSSAPGFFDRMPDHIVDGIQDTDVGANTHRKASFVSAAGYGSDADTSSVGTVVEYDDVDIGDDTMLTEADPIGNFRVNGKNEHDFNPTPQKLRTCVSSLANRSHPLDPSTGLGFCTWEALGPGVRPKLSLVLKALQQASERYGDAAITSVLIDDGWAEVSLEEGSSRGMLHSFDLAGDLLDVDVEPESAASPALARYVRAIKSRFPFVQHVGVWATLAGYWDGLSAASPAWERYGTLERLRDCSHELHGGRPLLAQTQHEILVPASADALARFWSDAFEHLVACGVEFVKIDNQAEWDFLRHQNGRSAAALGAQSWEGMMKAADAWLPTGRGGILHCMSLSPSFTNSLRVFTATDKSFTVRNTDDFFPHEHDAHRWHILHNAYNALLTGHIPSIRMDMDMFGASDASVWTQSHAALRAFSTARLWISESIQQQPSHAADALLAPACNQPGAAQRIVQASQPTRLISASVFDRLVHNPVGSALKMAVHHGSNRGATIGLWNIRHGHAVDTLRICHIAEALGNSTQRVAIFSKASHALVVVPNSNAHQAMPDGTLSSEPILALRLEEGQSDCIFVAPLQPSDASASVQVACFGIIDKYVGLEALAEDGFACSSSALSTPPLAEPPTAAGPSKVEPSLQELMIVYGPLIALRVILVLVISAIISSLISSSPARGLPSLLQRPIRGATITCLNWISPTELDGTTLGNLLRNAQRLQIHPMAKGTSILPWTSDSKLHLQPEKMHCPSAPDAHNLVGFSLRVGFHVRYAGELGLAITHPQSSSLSGLIVQIDGQEIKREFWSAHSDNAGDVTLVRIQAESYLKHLSALDPAHPHEPREAWHVSLKATIIEGDTRA